MPTRGSWPSSTAARSVTTTPNAAGTGAPVSSRVTTFTFWGAPGHTICWGMHLGHPGLLTANRWQELHDLGGGRTLYHTVDRFSGLLVPLMMALYGEPTRRGFESVAHELKRWVERERTGRVTKPEPAPSEDDRIAAHAGAGA